MKKLLLLALVIVGAIPNAFGQFEIGGQLIQRAELRNGFGKIITKNQPIAAHVGQRARITADYKLDSLHFHFSAQDIRVWGSAPTMKTSDGFLSVYEAFAETSLSKTVSVKLGRQELNYDNARFLGNVDWALQGRSHDFGLLKYESNKMKLHLGAGFNQDASALGALSGTDYTIANYKMAQLLHFSNGSKDLSYSFMIWNDGRKTSSGMRFSPTIGLPTLKYKIGDDTTVGAYYYHQLGTNAKLQKVNAFNTCLYAGHKIKLNEEKGSALDLTLGYELLTGTATGAPVNESNTYNPLYGTNHAHNGHMDYFFVGNRDANGLGLQDIYFKAKYNSSKKTFIEGDVHLFSTHQDVVSATQSYDKNLGTEIDLFAGYNYTKQVMVKVGYSHLVASNSFEYLQKTTGNSKSLQNWAYAMVVYKPKKK